MRHMPAVGLIRVETEEWESVKSLLLGNGYLWKRYDHQSLFGIWTADGKHCVSDYKCKEEFAGRQICWYYLDDAVLENVSWEELWGCLRGLLTPEERIASL